jgi:uncharacterized membrane protein
MDRRISTALTVFITALYPLAIWLGQGQVEPRWLAALLLIAAATRLPGLKISRLARWSVAGALLLAAGAIWSNALLPLKLYPVLVNGVLLCAFSYSLAAPPSMIERLARLHETDFPPAAVTYTRRVTQVWCAFFAINGAIALGTAVWASDAVWSFYTGVLAYVLMGLLFAIEYLFRRRFKRLNQV